MTHPTPGTPETPSGATRAPLAEGEAPESTPLERVKKAYDLVSDVVSPKTIGIVVAALAIIVAGLVGGWDTVEAVDKDVPTVEAGTPLATGPFEVTLLRAYSTDGIKPAIYPAQGKRYLVVVAAIKASGTEPQWANQLRDVITLSAPGLDQKAIQPTVYRLSDGKIAGQAQPSMTTEVVCVWEQRSSAPIPPTAQLRVDQRSWRQSTLDGSFYWLDPDPIAVVHLPITQLDRP